jgi:hypothetical protein
MTSYAIEEGVKIAERALLFAVWNNNERDRTLAEIREAIRTLFGKEVDDELMKKYEKKE